MLSDPHHDYTEEDEALDDLNEALRDLSTRSESIVYAQYHPTIKGQGAYGLPPTFMQMHFVGFRPMNSRFYPLVRTGITQTTVINENQATQYTPYYYPKNYTVSGRSQREKIVSTITTIHSGNSFDVGALPSDVKIGDHVINVTNAGAQARITYLDDDIIFIDGWVGLAQDIALQNQIRILSTDRAAQTLVISPPPAFTDVAGEESIYIFCAVHHRDITGIDVATKNDILDIDAELESALIFLTAHYIAVAQHGVTSPEAQMFEAKYERDFHKNMPSINSRMLEYQSLWFAGGHSHYQERLLSQTSQTDNSGNLVNR